ncbi:hypothetical protein MIDIC_410008 [Alphaproteobacteria bacterium]
MRLKKNRILLLLICITASTIPINKPKITGITAYCKVTTVPFIIKIIHWQLLAISLNMLTTNFDQLPLV